MDNGRVRGALKICHAAFERLGRSARNSGRSLRFLLAVRRRLTTAYFAWGAIYRQFLDAREILHRAAPKRLLTAGGDCAIDIAPIDYLHGLYPELTVIWFDAHMDASTPETSPRGNFHGMPVASLMGYAPAPMRGLMNSPLDPSRFFYYGIRVEDAVDRNFQRGNRLRTLQPETPMSGPIHIHFDLDVLEPTEFPFLAYNEPNGLRLPAAIALVNRISRDSDVVGLSFTEFAPADDDGARRGGEIIRRLCEATHCAPFEVEPSLR